MHLHNCVFVRTRAIWINNNIYQKINSVIQENEPDAVFAGCKKDNFYKDAVTFTNIREEEFESFLEENQIEVCDKQNARVNYVITPDSGTTSTKTKWAESHNKTILTITEAKQKFGYKNKE